VTVNVGTEISKGYTKGGQFLQMKVGDSKPAFLAIANAPEASEEGMMEFLIKDIPDTTASMIVKLGEGDEVCFLVAGLRARPCQLCCLLVLQLIQSSAKASNGAFGLV
jgi:hypothetical protein